MDSIITISLFGLSSLVGIVAAFVRLEGNVKTLESRIEQVWQAKKERIENLKHEVDEVKTEVKVVNDKIAKELSTLREAVVEIKTIMKHVFNNNSKSDH